MKKIIIKSLISNCFVGSEDKIKLIEILEKKELNEDSLDFIILLLRLFKEQDDFKMNKIINDINESLLKMGIKLNIQR